MAEILFLAHRIPYPPDRGDKIRSWHMLRHLGTLARVHLACFADCEADAAHLQALRSAMGSSLGKAYVEVRRRGLAGGAARALLTGKPLSLTLFDSEGLRAFVDRLAPCVDCIFAFSSQMAQFAPAGSRLVMDFVDVDSAKFADYARSGPRATRPLYRRESKLLFAFERSVAARAEASLFVSEAEAALFRAQGGGGRTLAISNGIDLGFFNPGAAAPVEAGEGPLIVFTGQMDYRPNEEAAAWFVSEVLPRLDGARFAIVGRNPTVAVRALRGERVIVTGAVPDVRPWLARAELVAAPLRTARGIQNKVLEAMAMAKAVVASPPAFEGIEAEPGRDLVVGDGGPAMAKEIMALLADPDRCAALGRSARALVERHYRWEARLAPLADIVLPGRGRRAA